VNRTILAIDASQRRTAIALARGPVVFERLVEHAEARDREPFWDELQDLFREAVVEPWQVEAVAVALGPGGFTGLRVSIAFAKAFAHARDVPAIGLGSAAVFAASDASRGGKGPWLVALASKSGTAWVARVTRSDDGGFAEEPGAVVDAAGFLPRVSAVAAAGGALLTDEHLAPELAEVARNADARVRPIEVDPCALAALAHLAYSRRNFTDALALSPIYPREPEAVTKWRERKSQK
jgi:tRNA threonylcarbamoyladenosine biosynthesis protein TsaB